MWAFEPKVALEVFNDLIKESNITLLYRERLRQKDGVSKTGARITEIVMESGARFLGKMFIDASYEGDLMAQAGVAYTFGREASSQYGESLNGISTKYKYAHQRPDDIDAYVIKKDPSSGLLPSVLPRLPPDGSADRGIMAFCFRMCLTNLPAIAEHKAYQLGFLWTLQNHPRVPAEVREKMKEWGLPKDEFINDGHWSPQLYIREGRRRVGDLVMVQQHCEGTKPVPEPIGMGSYTMDSHYVQRHVDARGFVQQENNFDRRIQPYSIGYGAIVPRQNQCENLLVPVCMSATHVAFGSIRMEPVFMILGQSAATAACLSIDQQVPVQQVSYPQLRDRLVTDRQVLNLPGTTAPASAGSTR